MRVDPRNPIAAAAAGQARRAAPSRFALDGGTETRAAASGTGATGVGGIEALLVLQGGEDPAHRRRRQVQRGHDILDALDGLKAAILGGRVGAAQLIRIRQMLAHRRETSDDPRLDDLIGQIELRAAVELAKLGRASSARPSGG